MKIYARLVANSICPILVITEDIGPNMHKIRTSWVNIDGCESDPHMHE